MAATSPLEALLGPTLRKGTSDVATSSLSSNEVIGLYFSAHWCPPCRGFTPKLAEIYTSLQKGGKAIEIVFVSSDRDEGSFNEYFGEQPWHALPFGDRERKGKLSSKYKVKGIPTLVLINGATGELITTDGRSAITSDPAGVDFPWTPKTVAELLGDELRGPGGAAVPMASLAGKSLALYFSAHWCPPCRGFTPKLAATYNAMKAAGRDDFEFVFVSSDKDEDSFNEYAGTMPWLSLPFSRRKEKEALSSLFGVNGIPTLVTLDADLKAINKDARGPADNDPTGKSFPWFPLPVEDISTTVSCGGSDVNEKPAVVILCDGASSEVVEACKAGLTEVAVAHNAAAAARGEEPELIFFFAGAHAGPVPQVKGLCGLPAGAPTCSGGVAPTLLLLDIPDNGGFYTEELSDPSTAARVRAGVGTFLDAYAAKALDRKQLSK